MAKPIYEMNISEIIDYINSETKKYVEAVETNEEVTGDNYFTEERFNDEELYNLFFACETMYATLFGAEYVEQLEAQTLQMFEPLQVEFRKRVGHPDPYGASTAIKL